MTIDINKLIDKEYYLGSQFFKHTAEEEARQIDHWLRLHLADKVDWVDEPKQLDEEDNLRQAVEDFTKQGYVVFFVNPQYADSVDTAVRQYILVRMDGVDVQEKIDNVKFSLKTGNRVV